MSGGRSPAAGASFRRPDHARRVVLAEGACRKSIPSSQPSASLTSARRAAQGVPMTPDQLLAREEIAHTQAVYNTEGDRGRIDGLLATFIDDGVLELDRGVFTGTAE